MAAMNYAKIIRWIFVIKLKSVNHSSIRVIVIMDLDATLNILHKRKRNNKTVSGNWYTSTIENVSYQVRLILDY